MAECGGNCKRQVHEVEVTKARLTNAGKAPADLPKQLLDFYYEQLDDLIEARKDRQVEGCKDVGCECREIAGRKPEWTEPETYTDETFKHKVSWTDLNDNKHEFEFEFEVSYKLKARIYEGICIDAPKGAKASKDYSANPTKKKVSADKAKS
jgi:hypothetical protein